MMTADPVKRPMMPTSAGPRFSPMLAIWRKDDIGVGRSSSRVWRSSEGSSRYREEGVECRRLHKRRHSPTPTGETTNVQNVLFVARFDLGGSGSIYAYLSKLRRTAVDCQSPQGRLAQLCLDYSHHQRSGRSRKQAKT